VTPGDRLADPRLADYQRLYLEGVIDGVAPVAADADAARPASPSRIGRTFRQAFLRCRSGLLGPAGCRCRYEPNVTVYE
jgi:hypothetical protein